MSEVRLATQGLQALQPPPHMATQTLRSWTRNSELAEPGTPRYPFLDNIFTKWVDVTKNLGTLGTAFAQNSGPDLMGYVPGVISRFFLIIV